MAPTILTLTPNLMPIIKQAGIDPVYFGVLFIINNEIGLITPPVGVVAQRIVLFLMILFPALVTVPAK